MTARVCYHCKALVQEGAAHDCWTTTEAALTRHLSEDLREAWERLRETAASFGDQRIYASHNSIMFSRRVCYFFVRPKRAYLELCVFLGHALHAPQVRKVANASKTKFWHLVRITHRDEVEPPITAWLREAYDFSDTPSKPAPPAGAATDRTAKRTASAKSAAKRTLAAKSMATKPVARETGAPGKRESGKQLARLRRICLSIPGAIEKLSHGEPAFFTPKKVFAMFANNHHSNGRVAVWLPAAAGVQAELIEEAPGTYFRPPYVGSGGWVGVELSKVDDEQLGVLVLEAFRHIDRKIKTPHRAKPARRQQRA